MKHIKKITKKLEGRRQEYDRHMNSLDADKRTGYTKPGSMNLKKR